MIKIPVTEWATHSELCPEINREVEIKLNAYRGAGYQVMQEMIRGRYDWLTVARHYVIFHNDEEDKAALFKLTYL